MTRRPPGAATGAGATTVRLSLLRGPRYPDPDTDLGKHRFAYSLVCGAEISDAVREGYRANLPSRAIIGSGPVAPLIQVSGRTVVAESVKAADDRSGDVVVRLYESVGGRGEARLSTSFDLAEIAVCDLLERRDPDLATLAPLSVAGNTATLALSPFQVVTLRMHPKQDTADE